MLYHVCDFFPQEENVIIWRYNSMALVGVRERHELQEFRPYKYQK